MAQFLHKGSWWADFRYNHRRYRVRSPLNTKGGAKEWEVTLRGRLARGEPLIPAPPKKEKTFAEFAAEWFETYVRTNNKPSEQASKRVYLRAHLCPAFGDLPLSQVSAERIERYKADKLRCGQSPKSVNNHLAVLGRCLRMAAEWEQLERVPRIRLLSAPPPSFDFLLPEESDRLLGAIEHAPWRAMVLVALRTGLRFGELVALEWQDVDLGRSVLAVRRSRTVGVTTTPKNNRVRFIPLTRDVVEALAPRASAAGLVFSLGAEKPIARMTAVRAITRFCELARLRRIGWHVLRHTFASQLATAGVAMKTVQELLGHSTIRMTERYAHLAPSVFADAVAVLDTLAAAGARSSFGHPVATPMPPPLQRVSAHEPATRTSRLIFQEKHAIG